jgi:ABC-type antimicrobial peptide transport system permease subunit
MMKEILFSNQIRGILEDNTLVVVDVSNIEANLESTLFLLQIFVIFIGAIAFTIAFFMLLVSTTANIRENQWEFGVLRAIGLRKNQLIRIYLYEALAVNISASILGLITGFILATILSLQFNIFLEMPFSVEFPYTLVLSMIGLGLIITIIGTLIPLREVNNRTISSVLKAAG